jgi:hypothetical protein
MKNEIDIIRDFSAKFGQAGIAYMLTGSMAMNYYAQPILIGTITTSRDSLMGTA